MPEFKTILVTTDLSDRSWKALEPALDIAEKFGSEVHVLTIVDPAILATSSPVGEVVVEDFAGELARMRQAARGGLERALEKVKTQVKIKPVVSDSFDPVREIARQAKKIGADLVVMATHGRTGLSHIFMGSTAEKVVRTCPVPVMTVRAHEVPEH